jgi:hypothetical protein
MLRVCDTGFTATAYLESLTWYLNLAWSVFLSTVVSGMAVENAATA